MILMSYTFTVLLTLNSFCNPVNNHLPMECFGGEYSILNRQAWQAALVNHPDRQLCTSWWRASGKASGLVLITRCIVHNQNREHGISL